MIVGPHGFFTGFDPETGDASFTEGGRPVKSYEDTDEMSGYYRAELAVNVLNEKCPTEPDQSPLPNHRNRSMSTTDILLALILLHLNMPKKK